LYSWGGEDWLWTGQPVNSPVHLLLTQKIKNDEDKTLNPRRCTGRGYRHPSFGTLSPDGREEGDHPACAWRAGNAGGLGCFGHASDGNCSYRFRNGWRVDFFIVKNPLMRVFGIMPRLFSDLPNQVNVIFRIFALLRDY
jgi:hypothetical protein